MFFFRVLLEVSSGNDDIAPIVPSGIFGIRIQQSGDLLSLRNGPVGNFRLKKADQLENGIKRKLCFKELTI